MTGRHPDYAENIGVQVEFMGLLAMVVDRVPCKEGVSQHRQQYLQHRQVVGVVPATIIAALDICRQMPPALKGLTP